MKILIVEDEEKLLRSILDYLKSEKYVCEYATDYAEASEKIFLYEYDCIILDLTLPHGDGLGLLKELKDKKAETGVIIISARNSLDDRIKGLELGSDDYLAKPFHLSELNARVKAIIRRKGFEANNVIEFNEISVDINAKVVTINGTNPTLTHKEYELLLYFMRNKKRVITKNSIAEHLWGDDMDMAESFDSLYAHIKNLRKKILVCGAPDYIKTVYGLGYTFKDN